MLRTLAPLLIASPAPRSGTTLLQRLLCSSPDAVIFGESVAHDMNLLLSLLQNKKMLLGGDGSRRSRQFEQVVSGDVNDWIPDLLPDGDWVLQRFEAALSGYFAAYADVAGQHGRRRWGAKLPAWPVPLLAELLDAMPGARLVYVVRDLESTVRSAKLIGACGDADTIREFCLAWREHQRQVARACPADRTLRIDYRQLYGEAEPVLRSLSAFAGVSAIDASVMDQRINESGRGYVAPPALDPDERELIESLNVAHPAAAFEPPGETADD